MTWAQSVVKRDVPLLTNYTVDVPLVQHSVEPGFYAVFARVMLGALASPPAFPHFGFLQLILGTEKDETMGRLAAGGAVKASTPVSLMVVAESQDPEGQIELIARGEGAAVLEARITIIALDEIREPVFYGDPPPAGTYDVIPSR